MVNMEESPPQPLSPDCVGREFVRQYYTMLHEAPHHLHRFYNNESVFVRGKVEENAWKSDPVVGTVNIQTKLHEMNLDQPYARIRTVESHCTVGSGVVVLVCGELSHSHGPLRKFVQTFVLAQQGPKKFYVHNDVFQYLEETFAAGGGDAGSVHDGEVEEEAPDEEIVRNGNSHGAPTTTVAAQYQQSVVAPRSESCGPPELSVQESVVPDVVAASFPTETASQNSATDYNKRGQSSTPVPRDASVDEKGFDVHEEAGATTWASKVAKAPVDSSVSAQHQHIIRHPRETTPHQPPPQGRAAVPSPAGRAGTDYRMERAGTEGTGYGTSSSGPHQQQHSDRISPHPSREVFLGRIPFSMSEDDVRKLFGVYGNLTECRLTSRAGRTGPEDARIGFLAFERPESAVECVKNPPEYNGAMFPVEWRKEDYQRGGGVGMGSGGQGMAPPGMRNRGTGNYNYYNQRGGGGDRAGYGGPGGGGRSYEDNRGYSGGPGRADYRDQQYRSGGSGGMRGTGRGGTRGHFQADRGGGGGGRGMYHKKPDG